MCSRNSITRNANAAPMPAAMSVVEFCPLTRRTLVVASRFPERLYQVLPPVKDPARGGVGKLPELSLVRFAEHDGEDRHLPLQSELLHPLLHVGQGRALVGFAVRHEDH